MLSYIPDSFDIIAIMTWGKGFGFLDRGEDVHNMIRRLDERMDVISPVGSPPLVESSLVMHFLNFWTDSD